MANGIMLIWLKKSIRELENLEKNLKDKILGGIIMKLGLRKPSLKKMISSRTPIKRFGGEN
ncbi:hypothetical protein K9O30_19525 [Clostridium bowmanii]|uniref:hypothetical protein n=1 Tax=Clostridium bowmanii TaxID=132925 RepID=UPI001C0B842D|nr:hypothetical protein [Clostridium bowmanii]MBU3191531.1 hypothetical protein [Clostridium bowmanii]MCA1075869.1 hypothetical protein [Clostridium bowmanii]